jgi:squalene synthase HpnC
MAAPQQPTPASLTEDAVTNPPRADHSIETPSGKWSGGENFPVGSWLLPARLRPHVMAFYGFARAADDIADNASLSPSDKLDRLELFEAALLGEVPDSPALARAASLRASLAETGVTATHAIDLLAAFKQDAVKQRYGDWADLMDYCGKSASPVGRYLLDLHGEARSDWPPSDALCIALQIINHLQDCQADYRSLDRVYLPQDWLEAAGANVAALDGAAATVGLRIVLDNCLDGVDRLLRQARRLPFAMRDRGLGYESAAILALAERLTAKLRAGDPIAGRVALAKPAMAMTALGGVLRRFRGYW